VSYPSFFVWYHWADSLFEDDSTVAVLHKEEAVMWYKIWRYLAVEIAESTGKWEDSKRYFECQWFLSS
jgi:hypothetical protein